MIIIRHRHRHRRHRHRRLPAVEYHTLAFGIFFLL
jgi:hypothetical protein